MMVVKKKRSSLINIYFFRGRFRLGIGVINIIIFLRPFKTTPIYSSKNSSYSLIGRYYLYYIF